MGLKWDWTVNIGNLIPIVSFLIVIVYKMSKMETKVDAMWSIFIQSNDRRSIHRVR